MLNEARDWPVKQIDVGSLDILSTTRLVLLNIGALLPGHVLLANLEEGASVQKVIKLTLLEHRRGPTLGSVSCRGNRAGAPSDLVMWI